MSEDPSRYAVCYEPQFEADRKTLGLDGAPFDFFFAGIEEHLSFFPWTTSSEEVPEGEGARMLPTEQGFPDIPALYVYYSVDSERFKITFLRLSPAWSKADLAPS